MFEDSDYTQYLNTNKAVIFDIDGVLADSSYAVEAIIGDKKDWKEFYERLPESKLNLWAINLLRMVPKSTEILIITGRCEDSRETTEKWLKEHNVRYDALYMRPLVEHDRKSSAMVKKEIYEQNILGKYLINFAIDDTPDIVTMWDSLGIPCIPILCSSTYRG